MRCGPPSSAASQPMCRQASPQALVEQRQHVGKDVCQVVHDVAHLGGDVGLVEKDLAGAPQALEHDLDLVADRLLLARRPHAVLALDLQQVEGAVVLEHGRALGLGRMRREHRLDPDVGQRARDLLALPRPSCRSDSAGWPHKPGSCVSPCSVSSARRCCAAAFSSAWLSSWKAIE